MKLVIFIDYSIWRHHFLHWLKISNSDETALNNGFIKNVLNLIFFSDPTCWSQADVASWLRHKMQELKIPAASCQPVFQWAANFEGPGFVQITEDEFKARLPQVL